MRYVQCVVCGYSTVRGPMSLVDSCPRCQVHGRAVPLVVKLEKAPSKARHGLAIPQARAQTSDGMSAPG
jgi:hypothetical protein